MKRVLLVTDFFRPEPGGIEGLFTGIARHWTPEDIEVIVTQDRQHAISADEAVRAFDANEDYVVRREVVRPGSFLRRDSGAPRFTDVARGRIEAFSPDHILIADFNRSARVYAHAGSQMGLPYSVFLNGGDLKTKLGFLNFGERRMALGARNIFAVSRYIARDARGYGIPEDRIAVIPPGFESRWSPRNREKIPEEIAARIKDRTLFVGLGPLVPRKGFEYALEAMNRLRGLAGRIHLLIVGSGPEFFYLQQLVRIHNLESLVTMTGFVSDALLYTLLQQADVMLQPGKAMDDDVETLGMAYMEAAWLGIPVIAGKLGGAEEIVRHGVSGFVIEPGDVSELANRIQELAESEKLRYRLGKTARDIARREFDMERTCFAIASRI